MIKYLTSVSVVLLLFFCIAAYSLIGTTLEAVEPASSDLDPAAQLLELRGEIDTINQDILKLLNKRAQVVLEIGKLKKENSMDVYDPVREKEIEINLAELNSGPLPDESVIKIFRKIITACRNLQ